VANAVGKNVTVYDPSNGQLVRTIAQSDGILYPEALTFDAAGNLYVSNENTVTEYEAGTATLIRTITTGLDQPGALALDASGNLYVANLGTAATYGNSVTVYASGKTTPARTIIAGIEAPESLALDSKGTLYVANAGANTVTQYANGKKKLTRTLDDGLNTPIGLHFDGSGNLYVVSCGRFCRQKPNVAEFSPGAKTPSRVITKGLQDPGPLAIDAAGNIFVGNGFRGTGKNKCQINEYAPGALTPEATIATNVHNPASMVLDGSGNLYVANYNGVCKGNRDGNVAVYPAGTTAGGFVFGQSGFDRLRAVNPMRLALTAFGVLAVFVLTACAGVVETTDSPTHQTYTAGTGRARPAADQTLYVGSASGIAAFDLDTYALERTYGASNGVSDPSALAEDASGNLWVADDGLQGVSEFAVGSTQLLQTITNGVLGPTAIAFDLSGNVYVANRGPVSRNGNDVTVYSPSGTLLRTIIAGIQAPEHLAFDSQGNIYVANSLGPVTEYDGGRKKLTRTIKGTNRSSFILVDGSDDLYVANCSLGCKGESVVEYGPRGKGVIRTITDGIRDPLGLALDTSGNLYVADANFGRRNNQCYVTSYAPGQTKILKRITDGVHNAWGVAVDASDNLYVMNFNGLCKGRKYGSVTVYPPGSTNYTELLTQPIAEPLSMIVGS
jgi:sugar lactone lactonase YvrE